MSRQPPADADVTGSVATCYLLDVRPICCGNAAQHVQLSALHVNLQQVDAPAGVFPQASQYQQAEDTDHPMHCLFCQQM